MNKAVCLCLIHLSAFACLFGCSGGSQTIKNEVRLHTEGLLARGVAAERKGDPDAAAQLLNEAARLSASIEDRELRATALLNLARLKRLQNEIPAATSAIDAALHVADHTFDIHAECLQEKAMIELGAGNRNSALDYATKAVAAERGDQLGRRLNLVARIQLLSQDIARAADTIDKALSANRKNEDTEEEGNSLRMMGVIWRLNGNWGESEKMLLAALQLDKVTGRSTKVAMDLEELASTAEKSGDNEKRLVYLHRAYEVNNNGRRFVQAAGNLETMAGIYQRLGNSERARELLTTADRLRRTGPDQTISPASSPSTTSPSSKP